MATSLPQTKPLSDSEADRLAAAHQLSDEITEAWKVAKGILETLLDVTDGHVVADARRWQVFRKLIRAADHELGKAVSK